MRLKIASFIFILIQLCSVILKAQEYHIESPGTLSEIVGEKASELTHIRVTGNLNDQDIAFLRSLAVWPEDKNILRHIDLEDATLENNALPNKAFELSYIESCKLPKNLISIGDFAFNQNWRLKEISIPEGVVKVGFRAFFWNPCLEFISFPESLLDLSDAVLAGGCSSLQEVRWSSKLKRIGAGAFHMCNKLMINQLPQSLEIIGEGAFSGTLMKEIVVPSSVKTMEGGFWGAKFLERVKIETPLEKIEPFSFYWCEELREINIPESVTKIGDEAFFWNLELRNIILPKQLTHIGRNTFNSAPLDSIIIPQTVTFIGRQAFCNNRNLKKVYATPVIPPTTSEPHPIFTYLPFEHCNEELVTLYVPKGSADAYRASEVFAGFKEIVELEAWQWPSSIDTPTMPTDAYRVYGKDGTLHIEANGNVNHELVSVNVYGISGTLVLKGQVTNQATVSLPNGFYVVQIGKTVCKISL